MLCRLPGKRCGRRRNDQVYNHQMWRNMAYEKVGEARAEDCSDVTQVRFATPAVRELHRRVSTLVPPRRRPTSPTRLIAMRPISPRGVHFSTDSSPRKVPPPTGLFLRQRSIDQPWRFNRPHPAVSPLHDSTPDVQFLSVLRG